MKRGGLISWGHGVVGTDDFLNTIGATLLMRQGAFFVCAVV